MSSISVKHCNVSCVLSIALIYLQLADARETLKQQAIELDHCKQNWLPKVNEMVATVSGAFGKMFADLGFAGEVRLRDNNEVSLLYV